MASKMRRLTQQEKQRVEKWALAKAQSERPSDYVTVLSYEFTDNEGRARYTVIRTERGTVNVEDIPSS
jgi:hypothetical protein